MIVRVAKSQFSPFLLHPHIAAVLFQVTHALLDKGGMQNLLPVSMEEFVQHLLNKVTHICSQLDIGLVVDLEEMPGKMSYPVIWEWFKPVGPENMRNVLSTELSHLLFRSFPWLSKRPRCYVSGFWW